MTDPTPSDPSACRETGHHKYDNPSALRATCERCGVVRQAVKVAPFWRGWHKVHAHLRWTYTYPPTER